MKQLIFSTGNGYVGLILRLTIGLVLFPHGAQKMLGWFGGPGFYGEMQYFTGGAHLPWLIGFLVIVIEFAGALSLIAGFATRLWSIALIILFMGMIVTVHLANGLFMNWFGNQKGEGYEYHLLVIWAAIALIVNGGGKFSIDRWIVGTRLREAS